MPTVSLARTSTGSPVSRLDWQLLSTGNCQLGVRLVNNGSLKDSEISWERAVTSTNPPMTPGEVQLANAKTQMFSGVVVGSKKKVWKPMMQQFEKLPKLSMENRKVLGNRAEFT